MNEHADFDTYPNGVGIDRFICTSIQAYNDSMPDASPEVRRALVIAWLKNQIALYL
jgi:hypothetical protein